MSNINVLIAGDSDFATLADWVIDNASTVNGLAQSYTFTTDGGDFIRFEGTSFTYNGVPTGGICTRVVLGNGATDQVEFENFSLTLPQASNAMQTSIDAFLALLGDISFQGSDGKDIARTSGGGDNLQGSSQDDTLFGRGGIDFMDGGGGNDTLDGGTDADTMVGNLGDDTFYVDNIDDFASENAAVDGFDRVFSTASAFTLGQFVENLTLLGSGNINGTGNSQANVITGNSGTNSLVGLGGTDTLVGGGGADTMTGGAGSDQYFVDNAGDVVVEGAGEGTGDRALTSISHALGAAAQIEVFTTTNAAGTGAINLIGNGFAQSIGGNAGANIIDGRGGADSMTGFAGNDWYYVDNAGDVVVEGAGQGTADRVLASITYTLGASAQVETLTTTNVAGTGAINLTGNGFAQFVGGNAGANVLNGRGGADTMSGVGGNDQYFVDNAGDVVVEGTGQGTTDRVFTSVSYTLGASAQIELFTTTNTAGTGAISLFGNGFGQSIGGNAGDNLLWGRGGNDSLTGFAGEDLFVFDTALGAGNVDAITDFSVGVDAIGLQDTIFTALGAGPSLAAGAFNTGAAATQADDRIVYNSVTGALLYDADGLNGVAGIQFATLGAGLGVTVNDFYIF